MARAAGVRVGTDGRDLLLEAAAAPRPAVLEGLTRHKAGIVALLRSEQGARSTEHRPPPLQTRTAPTRQPSPAGETCCKGSDRRAVVDLLKTAKAAGVTFFEHVANGDLVIEEPPDLA